MPVIDVLALARVGQELGVKAVLVEPLNLPNVPLKRVEDAGAFGYLLVEVVD